MIRLHEGKSRDIAYFVMAIVLGATGYIVFRGMYFTSESLPFAQEMVLVFLGAVATIYLTAALLNRQTELELRKEGRVIVLQQKSDVYMACIEKVAEIVEAERHNPDLLDDLRVLNHKLAVVGGSEVIKSFTSVLDGLRRGLTDGHLSSIEGEAIMNAMAEMTSAMREDILREIGSGEEARVTIMRNSRRMEQLDDIGSLDISSKPSGSA